VIEGKHLTADQLFIDKIVNFSDNLSVRFGVILVGGTLTGKTTLINTLYETLNDLGEL
jgi:Flp pilus assembly CpaF family ATPase